jgi:nucleotide-binding universal stress UspA family protein
MTGRVTVQRILLPLDGSELAEAVVPVAEALARDYEAGVLLLRALAPRESFDAEVEAQREAEAYLAQVADRLRDRAAVGVDWKVWYNEPAQAIADAAQENAIDLITMATHGRSGLERLRFGSVAERVVRRASVPVLLVRGVPSPSPGALGRILVPLDGSETSEAVLPVVARLAGPFDVTIDLLHAIEPLTPPVLAEVGGQADEILRRRYAEAEAHLRRLADALEARGLRVRRAVRGGPAAETIQRYGEDEKIGLIAMTTHGRSGLGRLLLGSVAEQVLRTATVPVLLLKAPAGRP